MPLELDIKDQKYVNRLKKSPQSIILGALLIIMAFGLGLGSPKIADKMTPVFANGNANVLQKIQALETKTELEERLLKKLLNEVKLNNSMLNVIFIFLVSLMSSFIFTLGIIFFIIGCQMRDQYQFIKKYLSL